MKSHVVSVVVIFLNKLDSLQWWFSFRRPGLFCFVLFCFGFFFFPPSIFGVGFFWFVCSTTLPPPVNRICFGEETPPPRYKLVNAGDPLQDHILEWMVILLSVAVACTVLVCPPLSEYKKESPVPPFPRVLQLVHCKNGFFKIFFVF